MVTGAVALAEFAHVVAAKYPVNIALHTDHCPKDKLDGLRAAADRDLPGAGGRAARSRCSSRTCGTARRSRWRRTCRSPPSCWSRRAKAHIVLEVEIGVVGGEEDGVVGEINEKLYTTPGRRAATAEALGLGRTGRYLLAATFGNVHGVYKPGNVKLRPEILKEIQDAVGAKVRQGQAVRPGLPRRLRLGAGGDPRGRLLRRGEDERRHRHAVRVHPADRRPHVHATTTACSRSTARSATRRPTTRARTARPPRPAWPPASSRPARTCCRPAPDRLTSRRAVTRGDLHGQPARRAARRPAARRPGRRDALDAGAEPPTSPRAHPASSAAWAALADRRSRQGDAVESYAYARTGYHRGLDALRRAGWKGQGPIPGSTSPTSGFLRACTRSPAAAAAIGEQDEAERCPQFLRDSSDRRPASWPAIDCARDEAGTV